MISTQQINYVITLAETGSFSRAAEQCFVTQPTLSMQVKKAEETLGFAIFLRDTANLELSDFGKALIPILRQIQGDLGSVDRLVQEFSGSYQEQLRIGVIPTIACYLLEDCFAEWQSIMPTTKLHIEEMITEELLEALEQRKIDLAILAGPIESTNFRSIPLYQEEIRCYVPNSEESQISIDELRTLHPWLLSKGNCLRTQMMHFCSLSEENGAAWNYTGGNIDLLLRMVDLNGGYTLIPENYRPMLGRTYSSFKRIVNETGHSPGRSVIAVSAFRHSNWESMEKLIRSMQSKYSFKLKEGLQLLKWR